MNKTIQAVLLCEEGEGIKPNLGRLRLMEFTDRIIKIDGVWAIILWIATLLIGVSIGRSYWLKSLIGGL